MPAPERIPYAKSALVFATQPGNPEVGVTTEQLIEIYAGVRKTWSDGTRIRLVLRPETDTDTIYLREHIPGIGPALDAAENRLGVSVAFTRRRPGPEPTIGNIPPPRPYRQPTQ